MRFLLSSLLGVLFLLISLEIPVASVVLLWKNCGYDMDLWLVGLNGILEFQYEAVSIDGCGGFANLRYTILSNLRETFFHHYCILINSFKEIISHSG